METHHKLAVKPPSHLAQLIMHSLQPDAKIGFRVAVA